MRSKTILSIAAFIVAFGFSVFLASLFMTKPIQPIFVSNDYGSRPTSCFKDRFQSEEARSIAALLRQDISNGRERDRNLYQSKIGARTPFNQPEFEDYAIIINQYVKSSSKLDASEMPQDFQIAWETHIKVWQDYAEFLNETKEITNISEQTLRIESNFNKDIDSTWYKVLRVGRSYGANAY